MSPSRPAFAPSLPLSTRPFVPSVTALRATRPPRAARVLAALPSPDRAPTRDGAPFSAFRHLRRIVRVSALSVALVTTGLLSPAPRAPALATPPTVKDTSATGDVEAAAMTLGAVTIGGLVMRAIVHARKDEEAERVRLQEECQRLEREEEERARRVKRKKMEAVEGSVVKDEELMSELMKRVQSLEEEDGQGSAEDEMRHSPIPDRGMGSAVLERPDGTDGGEVVEGGEDNEDEEEERVASAEELDMLNRMWNLSSGDTDKPNRPTSSS